MEMVALMKLEVDKIFALLPYQEAIMNRVTFNINQMKGHIWLEIPKALSKYLTLVSVAEIGATETPVPPGGVTRQEKYPWIEFPVSFINEAPGFHMYELVFSVDDRSEQQVLYFCYSIQTDRPEKSYVYMKGTEVS